MSRAYNANGKPSEAKTISLPFGVDIGSTLLRHKDDSLIFVTVCLNPRLPTHSFAHSRGFRARPSSCTLFSPARVKFCLIYCPPVHLVRSSSFPRLCTTRTAIHRHHRGSGGEKKAAAAVFHDKNASVPLLTDDEVRSDTAKVAGVNRTAAKPDSASHLCALYKSVASSTRLPFDLFMRTCSITPPALVTTVAHPTFNLDICIVTFVAVSPRRGPNCGVASVVSSSLPHRYPP